MSGLSQHHHHRGYFDERQVVGPFFSYRVATRRYCLDLRPEPFPVQVPLPVQVPVDRPLLLAALLRRDHRLGPTPLDLLDQPLLVVPLSAITASGSWSASKCRLGLGDVRLPWAAVRINSTGCPTRRSSRGLWCRSRPGCGRGPARPGRRSRPTFFAPGGRAGVGCGRPSSRGSAGRGPGRAAAARIGSHRPASAQRSSRRQTVLGLPNRSGRSAQGMPVRPTYRTASMKSPLSLATPPCSSAARASGP